MPELCSPRGCSDQRRSKAVAKLKSLPLPPAAPTATYAWLRTRRQARPRVGVNSVEILDRLYESEGP